jgi:uncharacterized RDD family membrane protein YckC
MRPVRRATRVAADAVDSFVLMPGFYLVIAAAATGHGEWAAVGGAGFVTLTVGYETLATARWGQTLGKRLVGIRVVRFDTLEPPSLRQALHRATIRDRLVDMDPVVGTIVVDHRAWRAWHALPHVERARRVDRQRPR